MDKTSQFLKIMFNSFWNPKYKSLKWFNRIMTVIAILFTVALTVLIPRHQRNLVNDYRSNYAINDAGQKFFNKHYDQANKYEKEVNDKKIDEMSAKKRNSLNVAYKTRYVELERMSENPDLTVRPMYGQANEAWSTLSTHVTSNENKQFIRFITLTGGQAQYVYENQLLPSLGIHNKDIKVRFVPTSGDLYITPSIQQEYPNKINDIHKRAKEIWNSCELSMRVKQGLTIHDKLNN